MLVFLSLMFMEPRFARCVFYITNEMQLIQCSLSLSALYTFRAVFPPICVRWNSIYVYEDSSLLGCYAVSLCNYSLHVRHRSHGRYLHSFFTYFIYKIIFLTSHFLFPLPPNISFKCSAVLTYLLVYKMPFIPMTCKINLFFKKYYRYYRIILCT
jgi:hypothetical protein